MYREHSYLIHIPSLCPLWPCPCVCVCVCMCVYILLFSWHFMMSVCILCRKLEGNHFHLCVCVPHSLYSPKGSVPDPISPDVLPPFGEYLLLLGLLHLFFSLWMVAEYFVVNWPNFIIKLPDFVFSIKKRYTPIISL